MTNTIKHLMSRLAQGLALVLAVVVLNFVLVHAAPGDPVETIAGASGGMDEKLQAELRAQYGLDQPLPVQLGIYLGKVLPSLTLGLVYLAQYSRLSRAAMLDVLGADYIRTARAKGLSERVVLYKHALRNAVLPVVTVLGLQFGNVLAGAIVVETVFNWPGLGRLAYESVLRRDYPTILGVLLFASVVVVVMNQITDLCYRLIDPRIKTA